MSASVVLAWTLRECIPQVNSSPERLAKDCIAVIPDALTPCGSAHRHSFISARPRPRLDGFGHRCKDRRIAEEDPFWYGIPL